MTVAAECSVLYLCLRCSIRRKKDKKEQKAREEKEKEEREKQARAKAE